jgi:hypothetical protein
MKKNKYIQKGDYFRIVNNDIKGVIQGELILLALGNPSDEGIHGTIEAQVLMASGNEAAIDAIGNIREYPCKIKKNNNYSWNGWDIIEKINFKENGT